MIFFSCSYHIENIDDITNCSIDNESLLPICNQTITTNTIVSEDMLSEYLKITKKLSSVSSIIPLLKDNDTLAYFVQYFKGWDVISADTRIEPVLAKSDSTIIDLDSFSLSRHFAGTLDYIQSVRNNNEGSATRLWTYLQLRVLNKSQISTPSTKSPRGIVSGMWREVDDEPQYSDGFTEIPHIISVTWGQGDLWNEYMPIINTSDTSVRYLAGCGTVAVGQVIHHFRKNNSRNIAIPTSAIKSNNANEYPSFSNFSSSHWNNFSINEHGNQLFRINTNIFLSYLAEQIDATLNEDRTSTSPSNLRTALNLYELDYNEASSYNYNTIYDNLQNGKPVIVGSESINITNPTSTPSHHYYIIDRYKESTSSLTTTYVWIPDYHPTDWELQTLPQWRFEQGFADGREIHEVTISSSENIFFGMNWGYASEAVDEYYIVRTYTSEFEDEAGTIPGIETIYTPLWTLHMKQVNDSYRFQNISSVFYNIREKN